MPKLRGLRDSSPLISSSRAILSPLKLDEPAYKDESLRNSLPLGNIPTRKPPSSMSSRAHQPKYRSIIPSIPTVPSMPVSSIPVHASIPKDNFKSIVRPHVAEFNRKLFNDSLKIKNPDHMRNNDSQASLGSINLHTAGVTGQAVANNDTSYIKTHVPDWHVPLENEMQTYHTIK